MKPVQRGTTSAICSSVTARFIDLLPSAATSFVSMSGITAGVVRIWVTRAARLTAPGVMVPP